jgi:ubiquinol-cytochrome c reductase cytochrome c1 subunit
MVRPIGILAGLVFVGILAISLIVGAVSFVKEPPAPTAEHEFHKHPKELALASNGPLGKFDRAQLQRGFQVYKEVCSACHSLHYVSFRDLQQIGFSEAEVKAIADQWAIEVPSIDPATGEATTRKATPADRFPSPYPNETAARAANNNALPPDLSLMTKARHNGTAYVHSLLTGYEETQPAELLKKFPDSKTPDGLYYNPYFANLNIAMPQPIVADEQVTYAPGQPKATVDQMATDVAAFLTWTAEPKLENRHRTGVGVIIFLLIATTLAFLAYRNIWSGVKH